MGDNFVVKVDQLPKPDLVEPTQPVSQAMGKKPELVGSSSSRGRDDEVVLVVENADVDEGAPLMGMGECRICQEEDTVSNLETPCACSGSLKVILN